MTLGRKLVLSTGALALTAAFVTALTAGPASAGNPPFHGPAVGTVSCTGVTIKVSFSPPLMLTTGGASISVKGKVSSCSVSGTPAGVTETITQGKITGTATESGTGCAGLATDNTNPINITVVWKGKYNNGKASFTNTTATLIGDHPTTDSSGNSGFEVPNPATTGSSASGSFAGPVTDESTLFTAQSPTAIANLCGGPHGLKKLNLTHGTATIP